MSVTSSNTPWFNEPSGGGAGKVHTSYKPCYESHKPLSLKVDGKEFLIYGGSCSHPVVKDADIYVGLSDNMLCGLAPPWDGGIEFCYPVSDMKAPKNGETLKKLVEWLCNQLHAGKKIHVGCMGGHGRTGTLLSAVAYVMTGEADAITYVRKNYCEKAVESKAQIAFLHEHYGITIVKPAKDYSSTVTTKRSKNDVPSYSDVQPAKHGTVYGTKKLIIPAPSSKCVW